MADVTHIATPWGIVEVPTAARPGDRSPVPPGMRPMPAGGNLRPLDPATGQPIPYTPRQVRAAIAGLVAGEPTVGLADLPAIQDALDAIGRGFRADPARASDLVAEEGTGSPSTRTPFEAATNYTPILVVAGLVILLALVAGTGTAIYLATRKKGA